MARPVTKKTSPKWSKEVAVRRGICRYCNQPIEIGRKAIFLRDINIKHFNSMGFHEKCLPNIENTIDNTLDARFSPVEFSKKEGKDPSIGANVITETSLQVDSSSFDCEAEYIHSRKSSEGNFRGSIKTSYGKLWLVEHEWKVIGAYDPEEVSDKDVSRSYFRIDNK